MILKITFDSTANKSEEEMARLTAHSAAIKTIVNDLLDRPNPAQSGQEEEELEGEADGGPKTAEVPDPDPISTADLLSQVNFSPDLTPEQRLELEKVVLGNKDALQKPCWGRNWFDAL